MVIAGAILIGGGSEEDFHSIQLSGWLACYLTPGKLK